MSWFFGSSTMTVQEAKQQIYAKVRELAPRVHGYNVRENKDELRWLANQIGLRVEGASPAASPAASVRPASGGRRRRPRKTRKLRR